MNTSFNSRNIKLKKSDAILVISGEHPNTCVGGAEFQAYLIANMISEYVEKTIFITMFSKNHSKNFESSRFVHISLPKESFILKIVLFTKYVWEYRPFVIYVRCLYSFWWVNIIAQFLSIPTVYHLSGDSQAYYNILSKKSLAKNLLKNFYIWNTKFADKIVAQTKAQADLYNNTFNRVPEIIHNSQWQENGIVRKDYSRINIIWIGKSFKNPERFIKLASLMSNNPRFHFFMAGQFSEIQKDNFRKFSKDNSNFSLLGELVRDEVYKYLRDSHVLINTSDVEGFPNTFIEAWHRGVIVISDKINPDNLLTDFNVGFVCKDINEMKNKIEELFASDISEARLYSERAIDFAKEYHSPAKTGEKVYKLIEPYRKG